MDKHYLIDTNVFMQYPNVITAFGNIHVHLKTIEELDYLKENENGEVAHRARKAAKVINNNLSQFTIETKTYFKKNVDDILWKCSKKNGYVLVTNDLTLRLKAKFNKVEAIEYHTNDLIYSGTTYIKTIPQEIPKLIEDLEYFNKLKNNEFVIFEDENILNYSDSGKVIKKILGVYWNKDGRLEEVKDISMRNSFYPKICARNVEQKCLINALQDDTITILSVAGGYGVG